MLTRTYVRPSEIKEGDIVFVRRDNTKRKRDTPYRPEPFVVIAKKGSIVTARNKSGTVTLNSSFFKKASIEIPHDEDIDIPVCRPEGAVNETPKLPRYPRQERRRPNRYGAQFQW